MARWARVQSASVPARNQPLTLVAAGRRAGSSNKPQLSAQCWAPPRHYAAQMCKSQSDNLLMLLPSAPPAFQSHPNFWLANTSPHILVWLANPSPRILSGLPTPHPSPMQPRPRRAPTTTTSPASLAPQPKEIPIPYPPNWQPAPGDGAAAVLM